jgi:hypothetical protein
MGNRIEKPADKHSAADLPNRIHMWLWNRRARHEPRRLVRRILEHDCRVLHRGGGDRRRADQRAPKC